MSYYHTKPEFIEAHIWTKNGSHPKDGGFGLIKEGSVIGYSPLRITDQAHEQCDQCNRFAKDHGFVWHPLGDTIRTVCPGDYIETVRDDSNPKLPFPKRRILGYRRHAKIDFEAKYIEYIHTGETA